MAAADTFDKTRRVRWAFTLNSAAGNKEWLLECRDRMFNHERVRAIVCQMEMESCLHLQGYLELKLKSNLTWLKENLCYEARWEAARKPPQANYTYCTKDETRVDGPWEQGCSWAQGRRSDILDVRDHFMAGGSIYGAVEDDHLCVPMVKYWGGVMKMRGHIKKQIVPKWRDVEVHVIYGPPGTGKSRYVWENNDNIYACDDETCKWFDFYDGEEVLLLDEFNPNEVSLSILNKILDGYQYKPQEKGAFTVGEWSKVYIVTNYHPDDFYHDRPETLRKALHRRFASVTSYGEVDRVVDWSKLFDGMAL